MAPVIYDIYCVDANGVEGATTEDPLAIMYPCVLLSVPVATTAGISTLAANVDALGYCRPTLNPVEDMAEA